jgi:hypothetical protein
MAAKPKKQVDEQADPMVLTVSQHEALTDDEKQAFRQSGGTVTPDPIN